MPADYRVELDPRLVAATKHLHDVLTGPPAQVCAPEYLGLEWRVVVERGGKPASEIVRTRGGVTVAFFADPVPSASAAAGPSTGPTAPSASTLAQREDGGRA